MKNINNPKLVLFDIDGLLVKGHYPASLKSHEAAIQKVFGLKVKLDISKYDGGTDQFIEAGLLQEKGISYSRMKAKLPALIKERVNYFVKHTGKDFKKRLIKPAIKLAKKLKEKDVYIGLLTGNFRTMAMKKLELAGAEPIFTFGLFGEMAKNRNDLAKLVFKRAFEYFGIKFLPNQIYIIGDTPKDVECGKAIRAKTIAVATGAYSKVILEQEQADLTVDNLADVTVLDFILK